MGKQLSRIIFTIGTDPEGFLQKDGKIIGSERVIAEEGVGHLGNLVTRDGIQFELHPKPSRMPQGLGLNISSCFRSLRAELAANPGVTINWDGMVEVEREELDSLSEKSRELGCQPSDNFYGEKPIDCDPKTYRKRSAGGHLHLDVSQTPIVNIQRGIDERYRLPLLDIFVGNTCVLIDRDVHAAERRVNYGRAGEHRKTPYNGIEYRTLSNFWLRDYALMDLVFGLARIAVATLSDTMMGLGNYEEELVKVVNIDRVIRAIDTNDWYLAMDNFDRLIPFLKDRLPEYGAVFGLNRANIEGFVKFANAVKVDGGLDKFFPGDPVESWIKADFETFERFLQRRFS